MRGQIATCLWSTKCSSIESILLRVKSVKKLAKKIGRPTVRRRKPNNVSSDTSYANEWPELRRHLGLLGLVDGGGGRRPRRF